MGRMRRMGIIERVALYREVPHRVRFLRRKNKVIIGQLASELFGVVREIGAEEQFNLGGCACLDIAFPMLSQTYRCYEKPAEAGTILPGYDNAVLLGMSAGAAYPRPSGLLRVSILLAHRECQERTEVDIYGKGSIAINSGCLPTSPGIREVGPHRIHMENKNDPYGRHYQQGLIRDGQNSLSAAALVLRGAQEVAPTDLEELMQPLRTQYHEWNQMLKPGDGWDYPADPDVPLWAQTTVPELVALRDGIAAQG